MEISRNLLSEKEACALYLHSRTWFWGARERGILPFVKSGRKILYDRRDLDRYFESAKQQKTAA